jgi:choloylglycine hydrolase
MKSVRIQGVKLGAEVIGTHVAAVDPSGDSAIFEILDGELVVHHGSEYNVMTNDPSYDWQVTHLAQYQNFGGVREIPGGVEGADRFVRLAHFSHYLPEPRNSEQAAGYALSAIRSVAVPFGAPYLGRGGEISEYPTWWLSVTDLEKKRYYFNWTKSPNIVWVDLEKIDFSEGTGKRTLDPKEPGHVGNVSRSFKRLADE